MLFYIFTMHTLEDKLRKLEEAVYMNRRKEARRRNVQKGLRQ